MAMPSAHVGQLCEMIQSQVEHVLASRAYQGWISGLRRLGAGDFIVLNNSFLFRQGATATVKNPAYLALRVAEDGHTTEPALIVQPEGKVNARFKHISGAAGREMNHRALPDAVTEQLKDFGTIVFALVGAIGPDEPAVLHLGDRVPGLSTVRFVPSQGVTADVKNGDLAISRLDDIDIVWKATEAALSDSEVRETQRLADQFDDILVTLREIAARPISIHQVCSDSPSILSNVVDRLADQVHAYKGALAEHVEHPDESDALNETLRIAYNFATGTISLLSLVVGLLDLKPIILWLTFGAQSDLSDRFAELPFALVGRDKPSLSTYRAIISAARNRAFHDVFAFGRPFKVPLESAAIRAPELHLFRDYSKRNEPALNYSDREVVELLKGLTRVAERPVPVGFWDSNARVMDAVCAVARSLQMALTACA